MIEFQNDKLTELLQAVAGDHPRDGQQQLGLVRWHQQHGRDVAVLVVHRAAHSGRLEDDQVVEIFIERERSRGVVGNIYKGRVSKVLPGMQSSFVDIGLERDAFLYVSEVVNTVEEFDRLETDDDEPAPEQLHGSRPARELLRGQDPHRAGRRSP